MDLKPIKNGKVKTIEIENLREAIGWGQEGKYLKILENFQLTLRNKPAFFEAGL